MIAPEIRSAILRSLRAGKYPSQIRRTLNVSPWVIRRIRIEAGLKPPSLAQKHEAFKARQRQAMALRAQGFTLNQIGKRLNPPVSGKRVHQLLQGTDANRVCEECGEAAVRMFSFQKHCTTNGAKWLCPECAARIIKPNKTYGT